MSLFSWMKWSNETTVQPQDEVTSRKTSGVIASRILIRELLWHVEEHERLARDLEREQGSDHSAPGRHWLQRYPNLHTLISTSELRQLEFLCAQVPPIHAATVLSRFREVLATNNIRPWDLASVFKQVMGDFLRQKEYDEEHNLSVQPSFVTPMVPNCGDHPREEIPTISGYVDWAMKPSNLFTGFNRDWSLSYYYPAPFRPIGAYSTTL
uniref:Uncharacterized protein n=1 Tax=Mola mola TaxID=94237 RepID=A0A3Q3X842_MOLML